MDWFAPAGDGKEADESVDIWADDVDDCAAGDCGGWGGGDTSSDDGFDSFEKRKEAETRGLLLNTERELYRAAEELRRKEEAGGDAGEAKGEGDDGRDGDGEGDGDGDEEGDEYDQRAAMSRWYAEQERASKPPFDEWVKSFLFLRVEGKKIELRERVGVGELEQEEDDEEEEIFAIHSSQDGGTELGDTVAASGSDAERDACPVHGATIRSLNDFLANELMNVLFCELASAEKGGGLGNGEGRGGDGDGMACDGGTGVGGSLEGGDAWRRGK